jgi:cell division protein FtsW
VADREVSVHEADSWLYLVTFLLAGAGLVMVLSASQAVAISEHRSGLYYFIRQVFGMGLGTFALLALRRVDYARLRELAGPAAAGVLLLMLIVLVPGIGVLVNGARRWINLGPLGTFQPSELGKLVFALYLASWVDKREDRLNDLYDGFIPFALLTSVPLFVLMLQKDLGTAIVMAAIAGAVFFAGGGPKRYVVGLFALLFAAFVLLTVLEPYRAQRLAVWGNPFKDALGAGFQSAQALLALGSGGLTGVGLGHSVQKFLWLPEAHTDFIFAIIGEETGLVGTTLVLAGFVFFAVRGYRGAMRAPDRYGVMVAVGITTWIAFQALINMATVTNTLPITGVPLPLISYGGTSVATTLAAIGVLLNVSSQGGRQSHSRILRGSDATVDLGRRDGGAPVTGTRRRASLPR